MRSPEAHLTPLADRFMDTREVLVVTPTSDGANVDLMENLSNARLDSWFAKHGSHKVGQGPALYRDGAALSLGPPTHRCSAPTLNTRGPRKVANEHKQDDGQVDMQG